MADQPFVGVGQAVAIAVSRRAQNQEGGKRRQAVNFINIAGIALPHPGPVVIRARRTEVGVGKHIIEQTVGAALDGKRKAGARVGVPACSRAGRVREPNITHDGLALPEPYKA